MFRFRFALGLAKCFKGFNSIHAFTYPQQQQYQQKMLLGSCQSRFYFSTHNSTEKDYYKILGVEEQATQEEIKKQFHKLAKLYHPDSTEKTGNYEEQFKEASEAYNILGDVIKRAKYDSERNLEKQRNEEASRQYNRFFKGGAGAYSQTHANYEAHQNAYAQSQRQSKQDEQRYKTYQDYQGFQKRDFDSGNMVPEGLWANMKDAPELWVISGIMLLLMLRWFIQSTTEQKNTNYSPDDDFEGGVRRGRIKLRPEDVKGMSLTQMDELDATGKYQLPPNAKATLEEYRSIARVVDQDAKKYNKLKRQQQEDDSFSDIEDEDEEEEGREAQRQREVIEKIKQEQRELMMQKMEWEEAGLERKLQAQQQNNRPKVQNYRTSNQIQAYDRSMQEKNLQNNLRKEQQNSGNNNNASAVIIQEPSNQGTAVTSATKAAVKDNNTSSSSIQLEMISKLDPKQLQIFGVAKKAPKEEAETLDNQVVSNTSQKVEPDISISNIKTSQQS